jgi:hypothetical protein
MIFLPDHSASALDCAGFEIRGPGVVRFDLFHRLS